MPSSPVQHAWTRGTLVRLRCPAGHVNEVESHTCAVVFNDTNAVGLEFPCFACGAMVDQSATATHLRLLAASGSVWLSR